MFHYIFVERVGDLQRTDEHSGSHIVIADIHQSYLALEIADILLEALLRLHFDDKEVVVILLELPSGSVLVIKGQLHLLEALERVSWECVEPVVGNAFETGREHATQE